jgi:hypothetical protein
VRLQHVFAFTTVAAILIAISGKQLANLPLPDSSPAHRALVIGYELFRILISAAAMTVVGFCILGRMHGTFVFNHPGHWLLVSMTAEFVAALGNGLVARSWFELRLVDAPWRDVTRIMMVVPYLFFLLGPCVLSLYVGWRKCRERRWAWVFTAIAVGPILQISIPRVATYWLQTGSSALTSLHYGLFLGISFGQLFVLVYAAAIDRQQRVSRDAIHWSGVGLLTASRLPSAILVMLWWLFT